MNRVIIVTLVVFLLIAPAFNLPAEIEGVKPVAASPENASGEIQNQKPAQIPAQKSKENEINGNVKHEVEQIGSSDGKPQDPTNVKPAFSSQSSGYITRVGIDGVCKCLTHNINSNIIVLLEFNRTFVRKKLSLRI